MQSVAAHMYSSLQKHFYLKNCLAKESASLKIPCSAVSLKQRELVFPDELSRIPGVGVLMEAPGEGAPFLVKFNSNA